MFNSDCLYSIHQVRSQYAHEQQKHMFDQRKGGVSSADFVIFFSNINLLGQMT